MLKNPFMCSSYSIMTQYRPNILGSSYRILAGDIPVFYVDQKFTLRDDIRIFADENKNMELLSIKARKLALVSAVYDVYDSRSGNKVGAFKNRGWNRNFIEKWIILDMHDSEVGYINTDDALTSVISTLIPSELTVTLVGSVLNNEVFRFHPSLFCMDVDFSMDKNNLFDRRMGIAAAVLVAIVDHFGKSV